MDVASLGLSTTLLNSNKSGTHGYCATKVNR